MVPRGFSSGFSKIYPKRFEKPAHSGMPPSCHHIFSLIAKDYILIHEDGQTFVHRSASVWKPKEKMFPDKGSFSAVLGNSGH